MVNQSRLQRQIREVSDPVGAKKQASSIYWFSFNISNKSDKCAQMNPPNELHVDESKKQICLKFRSTKRCNGPRNTLAVHRQERLLVLCIITECTAARSVSWGADAGYSIPDRLTDGGQNRLTATCLFSSFLGSKLLHKRCLLSTSYHWGFRPSCLICRKLPCDRFEVINSCIQCLTKKPPTPPSRWTGTSGGKSWAF